MNKHDIEELQAFLQSEYIEESTSRSLKEVKQHQTNINKNAVKADMTYIRNFARKCIESTNSTTNRNRRHITLSQDECKNEKDLFAFNYLMELYKKTENKKYFNQFFKLFGFDGSRVEIRGRYGFRGGLTLSLYVVSNGETFIPSPGLFFIHTTSVSGITALDSSTNNGVDREYAGNCIFFFAIKANDIRDAIKKLSDSGHKYGKYAYQYIPKKSDRFFVDSFHTKDVNIFGKRKDITAVFIQVKEGQKLPVKNVSNFFMDDNANNIAKKQYIANIKKLKDLNKNRITNIKKYADKYTRKINELEAFLKDEPYNEDYYMPKINELKQKLEELDKSYDDKIKKLEDSIMLSEKKYGFTRTMVESYIDETIERFDVFMEEFNNGKIGNSEFIMESAQDDKYAKIIRDYIKKSGRSSLRYKRGEDYLPQEVVDRIVYLCDKLLEFPENGNYNQYKTYYDTLCKIVHHPNTTNISYDVLDKAVYSGYINFGMNAGGKGLQHRCHLKPGTRLYHTSENGNLSILKPNVFIGDDVFYAAPRTYFYCEAIGGRMFPPSKPVEYDANNKPIITEEMKHKFKHVYMYTVKPGDSIFFDNELNSKKDIICGAVYLTYTKPIKLTKIY